MILLYLSDDDSVEELKEEIANYTIFYPISEVMYFFTTFGYYLKMHKIIDTLNVNWINHLMRTIFEEDNEEFEKYIEMTAKFKELVGKNTNKHLSKQDLITRGKYYNWIEICRKLVKSKLEVILTDLFLIQFVGLEERKVSYSNIKNSYFISSIKEDETKVILYEYLKDDINTMLINKNFKNSLKIKDISILNNRNDEKIDAYFIPLFRMPFNISDFYTSEILINLKSQIFQKFDSIASKINENIKQISLNKFDNSTSDILVKMYDSLAEENTSFQKEIDNNMYFKMIINNIKDCSFYQICLGVTTKNIIVDYYEKINVLEPFLAKSLKDKLELKYDLNSCKFFYYIDIIEPILN